MPAADWEASADAIPAGDQRVTACLTLMFAHVSNAIVALLRGPVFTQVACRQPGVCSDMVCRMCRNLRRWP
jgi:hypothetical protein